MAKEKEREVARKLFVELYKSQKEIAFDLGITEKTVGQWVAKFHWKEERDARLNNSANRAESIKKLIGELSETSLALLEESRIAEAQGDKAKSMQLWKERISVSQEVAMYQKALEKMEKNFKVSLSTYLEVMEDIFQELQNWDKDLFIKSLDFQKAHLQNVAQKLG
ncbi:MAG: hypothetical protein ITG00_03410 [Flavobacterium sp.]|nr:hypothetical protein [Flavobacterium sp.]